MIPGWASYRLDELAIIQGGGTPKRSEPAYFGGDIPWVTPSDLPAVGIISKLGRTKNTITKDGLARSSAKLIEPNSVLFSTRASIGKIAVTNTECATNQGFANFTPANNKIDTWFLAFLLQRFTSEIQNLSSKTTFQEVPKGRLKSFKVEVPSLEEQLRIVARIKECMERVDEIEKLRAESLKEGDRIQSAVFADYISSYIKNRITNHELGDVIVDCKYGTSKKANTQGEGYPILRMGNIQSGKIDTTNLKHIDLNSSEKNKYLLQEGDILINRTNSLELVGKSAVFFGLSGDWVYASYLIRLRIDLAKALPEYVNAVINSRIGRNYVFKTARRAIGMVNINAKEIQRMPLPLPSLEEQRELIEKIIESEPLIDELASIFKKDGLSYLRESILRKAFAGEL